MNLVIVESPAKTKTIKKFLGKDYQVAATIGHIRDLPKSKIGIDIDNDFKPQYINIRGKAKVINNLKELSKKAEQIMLAMDPDREGEAIAWHTANALKLGKNYQRISFNEITEKAVQAALKKPRKIDQHLVDAQQARRILDRIVGYKLSPLLWKKIAKGLSAGRVQSVALRLVVEREKEIKDFTAQEYWTITALLCKQDKKEKKESFKAILVKKDNKTLDKFAFGSKEEANKIVKELKTAEYKVADVGRKQTFKNPLPPFITSTIQQEAWQRFHWPARFTMGVAQGLYEQGFITYHRTDSLNLSQESVKKAKEIIIKNFGNDYYPGTATRYKTKAKSAQEAHEAIRPAYPEKDPDTAASSLDGQGLKLYDLIWRRFIASQMKPAVFDSAKIEIGAGDYTFNANGQTLKFDGFLKVYPLKFEQEDLPIVKVNEILDLEKLLPSQHFTQPPPRYTEATLVRELEKNGIGRPSTYAPIISVIQARRYVAKNDEKRFYPTEIGELVSNLLVEHFPKTVDLSFTAKMEEDLDDIADGKKQWVKVLKEFYEPFAENLEKKYQEIEKHIEETNERCPKCGAGLNIKFGRYGKFYGCSKFPTCRFTRPIENKLGIKCPKCGKGEIIEKTTKRGKIFYGCNQWPKCDFALWDEPTGEKCPKCGSLMVKTKKEQTKCSNKECL